MSYGCGCHDCCTNCCQNCCTVTPLFWVYMLGIAGAFVSLFFFFWQYPGTLTQFKGPKEEGYVFADDGTGSGTFLVFRDNLLIGQGALQSSDDLPDLRHARCRGTSLLWTMLISGFLGVLWLLWWFVQCPNRFVCCSLSQPYEAMMQRYGAETPSHSTTLVPPVKVPTPATPNATVLSTAPAPKLA